MFFAMVNVTEALRQVYLVELPPILTSGQLVGALTFAQVPIRLPLQMQTPVQLLIQ